MEENKNILPTESDIESGKVVTKHHKENINETSEKGPAIKKGKVDSLTIYEITDGELDTIERGSPNSTFFNIGIALISIAISFLVSLVTVDLTLSRNLFTVFTIVTVVSFVVGVVLMILWVKTKNDVDEVLKKIRDRIKED
jgi:amino acid transporter